MAPLMTDRNDPVKPVVTTTEPVSIITYTVSSSARLNARRCDSNRNTGCAMTTVANNRNTAIMGIALLVNCEPLTIRIAHGLIILILATSTRPVSVERMVTPCRGLVVIKVAGCPVH